MIFGLTVPSAFAERDCPRVGEKPVKLEAWMSKRYSGDLKRIRQGFAAMGNTRVALWVYPAENPSRAVAIGRCVPAYIARHALRKAVHYSGGVDSLVHQGFVSSHWVGVGTSLFDEVSQQKRITRKQLDRLMNESLDTAAFHELYRRFTVQDKKVKAFGLMLDNPKYLKDFNREFYPPKN